MTNPALAEKIATVVHPSALSEALLALSLESRPATGHQQYNSSKGSVENPWTMLE